MDIIMKYRSFLPYFLRWREFSRCLAICACSAALTISDIPLIKPIGAVRVGFVDNRFIINPTTEEMKSSRLDLVIAGTEDAVLMIEGFCDFLTEEQIIEAIETGQLAIHEICTQLHHWQKKIGDEKKRDTIHALPKDVVDAVDDFCSPRLIKALRIALKQEREDAIGAIMNEMTEALLPKEDAKFQKMDVMLAFKYLQSNLMRKMVLEEKRRIDGRGLKDIRPISIEQAILPRTHGCSLFTRGETQSLAVCTLGGETSAQRYEDLHGEGTQRFYLQYFFPPYSVGEVGRMGAPGRREIGHGKLAERALSAILPKKEDFPYVIRIESNITESNGSSSMASVCGGCLALMDAGSRSSGLSQGSPWVSFWKRNVMQSYPTFSEQKMRSATWTSKSLATNRVSPPSKWISKSKASPMQSCAMP